MKCPRCGNEVTQSEAFCGQCGTPNTATPPATYQPAERTNMPARSGLLRSNAYAANTAFTQAPNPYQPGTGTPPPSQSQFPNPIAPMTPASPYQQTGFHHDATEAMSPVLPGYQPQSFIRAPQAPQFPPSNIYPTGQFTPQANPRSYPFQTGNYAGPMPTHYPLATGQGYNNGLQGKPPLTPQKQSNQIILIVCITLVVILIGAVSITTFVLVNNSHPNQAAVPTTVPTTAPTVAPTPTTVPSPTPVPTPAPDTGFTWCGVNCSQNGFMTEFPADWQGTPIPNSVGVQFANPATPNIYAAFKTPGATSDASTTVLTNDVQTTFGSQPGYVPPAPAASATIDGAPWYAVTISYNDNQNQKIHVEVYATVFQGKAYIIELQAPDTNDQFTTIKQQSFVNMLVKFQFLPTA